MATIFSASYCLDIILLACVLLRDTFICILNAVRRFDPELYGIIYSMDRLVYILLQVIYVASLFRALLIYVCTQVQKVSLSIIKLDKAALNEFLQQIYCLFRFLFLLQNNFIFIKKLWCSFKHYLLHILKKLSIKTCNIKFNLMNI